MIEQRQKKSAIFCTHMVDFRRPGHIYTHRLSYVVTLQTIVITQNCHCLKKYYCDTFSVSPSLVSHMAKSHEIWSVRTQRVDASYTTQEPWVWPMPSTLNASWFLAGSSCCWISRLLYIVIQHYIAPLLISCLKFLYNKFSWISFPTKGLTAKNFHTTVCTVTV